MEGCERAWEYVFGEGLNSSFCVCVCVYGQLARSQKLARVLKLTFSSKTEKTENYSNNLHKKGRFFCVFCCCYLDYIVEVSVKLPRSTPTLTSYCRLSCMESAWYTLKKFAFGSITATVSLSGKYSIFDGGGDGERQRTAIRCIVGTR